MSNYDSIIEDFESEISYLDDCVDYHRVNGQWIEWRDYASGQRARYISAQAVLFAIKEGN